MIKVLNLYSGIGGNRMLWQNVQVTAVELDPNIASAYKNKFPEDNVLIADAHQYLLDNYKGFDFVWSSPPCPSHSKQRLQLITRSAPVYPDMKLYEEIIFLKHFFKGKYVVENVNPYYKPLIPATREIDRHLFWSNFNIPEIKIHRGFNINRCTKEELSEYHNIQISENGFDKRKALRNCVNPNIGNFIIQQIMS